VRAGKQIPRFARNDNRELPLSAQFEVLDFTGGGLGKLGDELYDFRALIARQALAHEGARYFISFVSGGALGVACGRAGAGATSPARWD
jgi:hypothetical protein